MDLVIVFLVLCAIAWLLKRLTAGECDASALLEVLAR